jgi:uncharacterized caspase-like protein
LADTRVALVIGNSAYKHAPALANPKNDAEGVAASLKRLGFEVLAGTDLEKPAMERLLRDFAQRIEKADVALVFYAGHGLQVNGRNYFVPIDSKLERESDLDFEAVPLELVQRVMEQGTRTNIIVLDACRDNPLARNLARSMGTRSAGIGRGLGQTQAGVGMLIVYATQPGNVALDGDTKNSPFTAALLKHIEAPGLEVRLVVSRVRQAVIEATKGRQVPWDSSSLVGEVYLAAKPATPGTTPPAPETKPPASTPPTATETPRGPAPDGEIVFWQSIQNSKNAADFKAYLEKYPNGTFAALAKLRIAELEKAADVTPPAPVAPQKPDTPVTPTRPQRVSSLDVGKSNYGDFLTNTPNVASARDCQAICLKNPQCNAWNWHHANATGAVPRACNLFRSPGWRVSAAEITSGVIRTTPAAAPTQPAAPAQPRAPKSQPAAAHKDEVRRRAAAQENEAGLCARTGWPAQAQGIFSAGPDGQVVRNESTYHEANNYCRYERVVRTGTTVCGPRNCEFAFKGNAGLKCVVLEQANCYVGKKCSLSRFDWTLAPGVGWRLSGERDEKCQ